MDTMDTVDNAVQKEGIGIKETTEVLVGINELALALCKVFADGFQASDFAEIMQVLTANEEVKEKMLEAVKGVTAIGGEIKDIDLQEGLQLAGVQLSYIPKIVSAFTKK